MTFGNAQCPARAGCDAAGASTSSRRLDQLARRPDHRVRAVGLDDVPGSPRDLVPDASGGQRLVCLLPCGGDLDVGGFVQPRLGTRCSQDDDPEAGHVGRPELCLGRGPVEVLDARDEITQGLGLLLVLGPERPEQRVDPVVLQVHAEAVDEDEAGHVRSVPCREDPRVHLPERMAHDDERRRLAGDPEQAAQVVRRVRDGVSSARIARPPARPVVGTRPGDGGHPVVDRCPAGDAVAHAGLEHDRR